MYKTIYIPVDNSALSNRAIDLATEFAMCFKSKCIGSHVYAAALHDLRFRQMESGLPPKYLQEQVLEEQRDIHNNLITKGLSIISESYLQVFTEKCKKMGLESESVNLEGRNYEELANDINKNKYELTIIGATGQGKVKTTLIGSVCERLIRRVKSDVLVVKNEEDLKGKKITVAMDGSPEAYGGLMSAIELAKAFDMQLQIVGVFDPFFHYNVFNSIAGVLSEEDSNVFNFKDQEKLHEEIIDSGLAKIYRQFLNIAQKITAENDCESSTELLPGKGYEKLLEQIEKDKPGLVVLGRIGIHSEQDMDIGHTTENILRLTTRNLLISSKRFHPPLEKKIEEIVEWTKEALIRLDKIPPFVRTMAKNTIQEHAISTGHSVITTSIIDSVLATVLPESMRINMGLK